MQKHEPIRDARQLGKPKMLTLGIQHLFAMFGATILVPILVQSYGLPLSIQTTLFFAGVGTLFFHLCTRFKVPAFLGSSFAFLGGFATMGAMTSGMYEGMDPQLKLSYTLGGVVVAGLLYLILALIVKAVGVKRVMRYLPPVVTGPIIICIGLILAPTAIDNASKNWLLAIIALVIIVICNLWGKGMIKIIPILMAVVITYIIAIILHFAGMTNSDGTDIMVFTEVVNSGWVGIPEFTLAKFDLTAILVMAPIAIATMMEHIGDMSAISATVNKDLMEDPGLHRSLIGDGIATSISAMFGGPANTTYGENTGVLAMSRVYDPRVIRIAAVFAILLGLLPKFSGVIGAMPTAIIGGVSFVLYGMISAIGIRNVVEAKVDFTKSRNLIVAAVILVCGLGLTDGVTFTVGSATVTLSSLAVAAIVGIVLNAVLPGKDYEFRTSVDPKTEEKKTE
ncbi:MAG: uracil-xanthine permease [Firmicutes bacterium]|nr:uracil-xanthine permease [Bacillota bacterium]